MLTDKRHAHGFPPPALGATRYGQAMNQSDWLRKRYRQGKKAGCAPEIGAVFLLAILFYSGIHSVL